MNRVTFQLFLCLNGKSQFMHRSEFEKFVVSVRPALHSRAVSIIGDADAADDVVQDCLLKLWSMRQSFDEYNSPEALALTITHRLSLNVVRGRRSTVEICDEILSDHEDSPEQKAINDERVQSVNSVMSMLPDAQQAIITMRHIEGLSNGEIAAIIGSNEGAVRTALSRARKHVAEIFIKYQLSNK